MATRAAATSNEELLTAIKNLESRMNERMTSMKRDLMQEREQADERLVKSMKMEKALMFKRKSHEVQYTFNEEVKAKFDQGCVARDTSAIEGEKLVNVGRSS